MKSPQAAERDDWLPISVEAECSGQRLRSTAARRGGGHGENTRKYRGSYR
jgi:hypothetical protein